MTKNIAFCSGGKDSVATLIMCQKLNIHLDFVVFCEVMLTDTISAEFPEHISFIKNKLQPWVETNLQCAFVILRSDLTFVDLYNQRRTRGTYEGQKGGFCIPARCIANDRLKMRPIRKFLRTLNSDYIEYIGITYDEPERYHRISTKKNKRSILYENKKTSADSFNICRDYSLLSPHYDLGFRNGCVFCPNISKNEVDYLISNHFDVFSVLLDLDTDVIRPKMTRTSTPQDLYDDYILRLNPPLLDLYEYTVNE